MRKIGILGKDDIIMKGDWCRPLYLCTMSGGHSDFYSFNSQYSGAPENNTKWCRVERIMPFWLGGTVKKFEKATNEYMIYEYVRGDIPNDHRHKDCEAPDYDPEDYEKL